MLLALWSTVNEAATPGGSGAIVTRSTRLSQPQGPVAVDYSSPFSRGLVGYINPALRDATQIGNPSYSKTPGGIAIAGTGSSLLFKSVPSFSNGATILFVGNWLTGGSHSASIGNSGSGDQCFIFQAGSTGSSRPRALIRTSAGGGVTTAEALGSGNDTQFDLIEVWCARYDGTTALKLYRNGEDYTNGNANTAASGSISTLNNIGLGGTNRGSDSFAAAGQLQTLGLYWNRALSDDEIRVIGRNPWQLFRPVQRRIYFDMGAGGGGTTHIVTADPVEQGSTTTRPGLTQTHVTAAMAVAQGATVIRPAITQTHVVTARSVAQGSTVNAPAVEVGSITVVTARAVVQSSTVNAPSIVQTHIVTARPSAQGGTVTRPGLNQTHTVTARAVTQSSVVNAPSVDVGSTPSTVVTARPVAQGSTVNAPGIRQTHVTSARAVVQGSTINVPGLVQTHVVTARAVVQASTVRVAGIAPPFVRSIYWAAVPSETFRAAVPSEKFSAAVPGGNQ